MRGHALFLILYYSPIRTLGGNPDPELRVRHRRSRPSDGLLEELSAEEDLGRCGPPAAEPFL